MHICDGRSKFFTAEMNKMAALEAAHILNKTTSLELTDERNAVV
jgi:hypothetical protein